MSAKGTTRTHSPEISLAMEKICKQKSARTRSESVRKMRHKQTRAKQKRDSSSYRENLCTFGTKACSVCRWGTQCCTVRHNFPPSNHQLLGACVRLCEPLLLKLSLFSAVLLCAKISLKPFTRTPIKGRKKNAKNSNLTANCFLRRWCYQKQVRFERFAHLPLLGKSDHWNGFCVFSSSARKARLFFPPLTNFGTVRYPKRTGTPSKKKWLLWANK